ncbi:MAG TPA: glycosyltransferase family 9 protein [Bacteroidales bacterium]|nr:glycosyltransferase family 9 protein [Bacteroidales bacterium]
MSKLSVAIITLNEEKNISRCIQSVQGLADEVVVIDSFSTDQTARICRAAGVRFEQHPFEGYIEQKNYALSRCTYPMVLALDADEALSAELYQAILKEKNDGFPADAYTMNRLTSYLGHWVRHSGWYPDRKLRLFNRTKARWGGLNPHDKVIVDDSAKTVHLKGDILHYSYHKPEEHSFQIEHFSAIGAQSYFEKGRHANRLRLWASPVIKFFRDYIIKLGILDGKAGWRIARLSAKATYLKYLKLRYLEKKFKPSTIIVSRTDSIGDVVLTLPLCGLIKKYYPDSKIIFLAKPYTIPVVRNCVHVDEIMDADALKKLDRPSQIRQLRQTGADTIMHVFPQAELAKLARLAGIKHRIGASGRWYHFFNVNHLVPMSRKRSDLHEAQLNMKLLWPLGIVDFLSLQKVWPLYGLLPGKPQDDKLFSQLKPDRFNLILHPKSKGSARDWPLERYMELARLLPAEKFRLFVGGTAAEGELVRPLLEQNPHVIDLTGQLDLEQYIQFIAASDGLIAASTGPLHIAAALGRIAIGAYPAIRPIHPGRWKPLGPLAVALTYKESCNDCKKTATCACMTNLDAQSIASQLNKLTDERNRQMAGSGESQSWQRKM